MNRVSMWDKPLVGLLMIIRRYVEADEKQSALDSIDSLVRQIEGCGEE